MDLSSPHIKHDHGLQKTFQKICDDAVEMAEELIERLDQPKLRDGTYDVEGERGRSLFGEITNLNFQVLVAGSTRSPEWFRGFSRPSNQLKIALITCIWHSIILYLVIYDARIREEFPTI
jgi:hypothetical protein